MDGSIRSQHLITLAKEYFRRGDAGDASIVDMFDENVELYFPKFGSRVGKSAVGMFVQGLLGQVRTLRHYPDEYNYIVSGDFVAVEGREDGVTQGGTIWPVQGRTDGRFCNVFRFRGELIVQLHIYVDPDFTGEDEARFYWGLPV